MSLVDLVLGSEDLSDFIRKVDYLDAIHTHSTAQVRKLADLKAELEQTEADLEAAAQQAREEADRASRALEAAQASRKQAEEKAAALAAAQAAAAQAAAAANEPAPSYVDEEEYAEDEDWGVDSENPEVDLSQEDTSGNVDGSVSQGEVDWSADRDGFVAEWGGRIDGYLAGTPLGGYGATFAAAAWDYGVDPRWSPAISCIESSCGEYCFREHNAWGWGSVSWDSWDEAIYDHVAGLARVYGSTITVEAAQKYCPPNSTHWYNAVLGEMNSI